jgi:hypothetical protein
MKIFDVRAQTEDVERWNGVREVEEGECEDSLAVGGACRRCEDSAKRNRSTSAPRDRGLLDGRELSDK